MKKRYKLDTGLDTCITLEFDAAKFSEDLAREINGFWVRDDDILDASGGDVYQAVARRAAGPLLGYLLDGLNIYGAVAALSADEGWPSDLGGWMKILDYEIPALGADDFDVTVL